MAELLPCPFCGGEAELKIRNMDLHKDIHPKKYELRVSVCVKCSVCHMTEGDLTAAIGIDPNTAEAKQSIYETSTVQQLAKRWNRRA